MSAKALFVPARGDSWTPADDKIALLPKGKRSIALAVWNAIVGLLPLGETEVKVTDWRLSKSDWLRGYSLRAVQKGLLALSPNDPESNADGIGLIERERRNGRRKIIVRARIAGRDDAPKPKRRTVNARTLPLSNAVPVKPAAEAPKQVDEIAHPLSPEEEETARQVLARGAELREKLGTQTMTPYETTIALTRAADAERARHKPPPAGP